MGKRYVELEQTDQQQQLPPPLAPQHGNNNHQRVRIAVYLLFFGLGWVVGHWVARIPDVKATLQLSEGMLGAALFCAAFGMLGAMPAIGWLGSKKGSKFATVIGSVALASSLICIGLSNSAWLLMASLFYYGVASGLQDVGMNSQAALTEMAMDRKLMGSYHAMFSVGNVAGATVAGGIAVAGASPLMHFIYVSIPLAAMYICVGRMLYSQQQEDAIVLAGSENANPTTNVIGDEAASRDVDIQQKGGKQSIWSILRHPQQGRSLLLLCLIGFTSSIGEGSVSDWSTVYLNHYLGTSTFVSSIGFGAFATFMAIGRLSTDILRTHFKDRTLLKVGGILACGGLLLVVSAYEFKSVSSWAIGCAVVGLSITGCGLSVAVPIVLSIAGQLPGVPPSEALAGVTGFSYLGMLLGPPMFGGISEAMGSLQWALLLDAIIMLAIPCAVIAGAGGAQNVDAKTAAKRTKPRDDEHVLVWDMDEGSDSSEDDQVEINLSSSANIEGLQRSASPSTVAAFSPPIDEPNHRVKVYDV